jgi:hypothetical protein
MFGFSKRKQAVESAPVRKIVNAYYVLDRELERMHTLLDRFGKRNEGNAQELYTRIKLMQETLLESVKNGDEKLQEKIAEFALTGDPDSKE